MLYASLIILLILCFIAIAFLQKLVKGEYVKKPLMTENEKEFFIRLTKALPEFYIFPQVAFNAILNAKAHDKKMLYSMRGKFTQKVADYIVCSKKLNILAVIELDDKTHNKKKDKARDAILEEAGYKVFRYHSRKKPSPEAIRNDIETHLKHLIQKKNESKSNYKM